MLKSALIRIWLDIRAHWWLFAGAAIYVLFTRLFLSASCPFYQVLGLPCAGCGMSRALFFILSGQFGRAFYINPLSFVIVLFALYCVIFRYFFVPAKHRQANPEAARVPQKIPGFALGLGLIAAALLLLYIIRMYLYFPDRIPYVYNYNNIMEGIIPGYRAFIRGLFNF